MSSITDRDFALSLFTEEQIILLIENGIAHCKDHDAIPVAHIRYKHQSWLISEICDEQKMIAYGLFSENGKIVAGHFDLNALQALHDEVYLLNDDSFTAHHKLSIFQAVSKEYSRIIVDDQLFNKDFKKHTSNKP